MMPGSRDGSGADEMRLRVAICGSADDATPTLLDRLLAHSGAVAEDRDSGWRYFATRARSFAAVENPRDVRDLVATASSADLALVLVDARAGIAARARRDSHIVSLMGVRHAILAVDGMDLADFAEGPFASIADEYRDFARALGIETVHAVPLAARTGENLLARGARTPWYGGPALLELLETVDAGAGGEGGAFRLPVGTVDRSGPGAPGVGGTVASGSVERGMRVAAWPSGGTAAVARVLGPSGEQERAAAGEPVTLVLADAVDASVGDMIADAARPPELADQFSAHLVWTGARPMLPERPYLASFAGGSAVARVTDLAHRVDVATNGRLAAKTLGPGEIGYCKVSLDRLVPFDALAANRRTGAFLLADRATGETVGAGAIGFALRRASNVVWQALEVDKAARARAIGQKPCVFWLTGLPGSGKSTIADRLEQKLRGLGKHTYVLDGDNVRHGLSRDLGFTDRDRVENIRRVAEVAKLMVDAGLVVIVSFISPFRSEREMARELMEEGEFFEIFVDAPLEVCEARDPKGLYAKARRGDIPNFTGIDSPYEPPDSPELRIDTTETSPDRAADAVLRLLR